MFCYSSAGAEETRVKVGAQGSHTCCCLQLKRCQPSKEILSFPFPWMYPPSRLARAEWGEEQSSALGCGLQNSCLSTVLSSTFVHLALKLPLLEAEESGGKLVK